MVARGSARLSNFKSFSAFSMPLSVRVRILRSSSTVKSSPSLKSRAILANSRYIRAVSSVGPEMMSGVRASSIRM